MPDPSPEELARIQADRARIFHGQWFRDLIAGRLDFGDTFWLGNYGILLAVVPVLVLLGGLIYAQAPEALAPLLRGAALLLALWRGVVLRALLRLRARGGWAITGLIWTGIEALAALRYGLAL